MSTNPKSAERVIMRRDGILLEMNGKTRRLSDYIELVAEVAEDASGKHRYEFKFLTRRGTRTLAVDCSEAVKPKRLADKLRDGGFDLPLGPDGDLVIDWLIGSKPPQFIVLVAKTGWNVERTAFVTSSGVIGEPGYGVRLANSSSPHLAKFKKAGTMEGWQKNVAVPAGRLSSRFILTTCMAMAAPLVSIVGQLSQGVHLYSAPGTAKTTALIVAGSTWGIGCEKEVKKLRSTATALEEVAVGHNGILLGLDEAGTMQGTESQRAEEIRELAYWLPGGTAKQRGASYLSQNNLQQGSWDLLFATTGEYALSELFERTGSKRSGGETSRLIDMPGVRPGSLGLIDYVSPDLVGDPKVWADKQIAKLKSACAAHHGHAFPEFIEEVIKNRKDVKRLVEAHMAAFLEVENLEHASGAEKRKVDLFALVFAAGALAFTWGVLPWTIVDLRRAISRCYHDSCEPHSNTLAQEGIERLRRYLSSGQLVDLREGKPQSQAQMEAADGVIRCHRGELQAAIKSDRIRHLFVNELQLNNVISHLESDGVLVVNGTRGLRTRQCRMPLLESKPSCYVLRLDLLEVVEY